MLVAFRLENKEESQKTMTSCKIGGHNGRNPSGTNTIQCSELNISIIDEESATYSIQRYKHLDITEETNDHKASGTSTQNEALSNFLQQIEV